MDNLSNTCISNYFYLKFESKPVVSFLIFLFMQVLGKFLY